MSTVMMLALCCRTEVALAQDSAQVSLEVNLATDSTTHGGRDPTVRMRNLFADTPWLSALRQGLPVRLQYRLEVWRSRAGWFDVLDRQVEWTVVVRHEPLLDQFSVVRLLPPNRVLQNRYATPGALAALLGSPYRFKVAPESEGQYYYAASLDVSTLSDSDLDDLQRLLKGELTPGEGKGQSLTQRARRLILRLAGLPTLSVQGRSESFGVR
ncbi:MAG: DUF4390 domain-containing protein [Gemmatimonadales bacterium]